MSTAAPVKQTRRAYTRTDYGYLARYYTTNTATAAACAAALGRKVGSLKGFLIRHPQLQKRARA